MTAEPRADMAIVILPAEKVVIAYGDIANLPTGQGRGGVRTWEARPLLWPVRNEEEEPPGRMRVPVATEGLHERVDVGLHDRAGL